MKFNIDELTIYFPYEYIYPEQYSYMCSLKEALDAKGPCVLEMPSGTGKTVTLLSFILSYKIAHPDTGKLVYCSRTVGECEKALEEAKVVMAHIQENLPNVKKMLIMGLSSRRNLCVHPRVKQEKYARVVDSKCRNMTAPWVRDAAGAVTESNETAASTATASTSSIELCGFFEQYERNGKEALIEGVYSMDDMKKFGEKRGWCPYFLSRHLLNFADVIIFSYQYVIDPKVSKFVSKELKGDSILVFDEAHNIDNVCIDALSVTLDKRTMAASARNLEKLTSELDKAEQKNAQALKDEYNRLVQGLATAGDESATVALRGGPVLAGDELEQAMPGNIRKAKHFLGAMRRLHQYLKSRLQTNIAVIETPLAFLQNIQQQVALDAKSLKFCTIRLTSLMQTLQINDVDQYTPVTLLADFAALVGTYQQGFLLIIEPYDDRTPNIPDPVLQFACLDASIAMRPVLEKFGSVIITSGTISPLEMYPRILNFTPVLTKRFQMSLTRSCICPMIVTRGADQVAMSTRYDDRGNSAVLRNYGALLVDMCKVVPDGIVCFFPSYFYLEQVVGVWNETGVLKAALKQKLLFVETTDFTESTFALQNYRKACDNGRGAVLLAVARGKVSEGIDFDHHYGRCVILFGIPYVYTESRILRARLEFLRDQYQIKEGEFLTFDAMRTASQCIGRVIRGKTDYGVMIFADQRYERSDKRRKMPQWVLQQLHSSKTNMTTDMAVNVARDFLKQMAQPWTQADQLGRSLWTLDHVHAQPQSMPPE